VEATGLFQKSSPLFDSNLLAIEAAANGQGVVVVPQFSVEADIANGTLVAPLASDVMQPGGWYLVHLEQRARRRSASSCSGSKAKCDGDARPGGRATMLALTHASTLSSGIVGTSLGRSEGL
jgi:hypothetical protein